MAAVTLNVYDMSPHNGWTYWCGVGIFHAGVEVHGIEWAYGGHDNEYTGIFATKPKDAPGQVVYRQSVTIGQTDLTRAEVEQLIFRMGDEYRGSRYHLLQRNCNHFASDLCKQLVGREAPSWVNRLASIAVYLHCILPAAWVPALVTPSGDPHQFDNIFGRNVNDNRSLLVPGQRSEAYQDTYMPTAVVPSVTRLQ